MSYQVLARKWRPRNFSTLVGQDHVVRALTHALAAGRLHHAYLFTGTRGVGKTTLARILAKSLNCEQGLSATPCGTCSACQEIDSGRFVDLLEVDAATNTKVDEMRQLLENAVYAPTRGRFKVYVIDEVHMLSSSAFNAMLKTLEEPPEHVKFILATTDPQKIPVTVLSRCLQFNLKQMPESAISSHLAHILSAEGVSNDAPALALIARAAAGSMRDALSLLDQAIAHGAGAVHESQVRAMLGVVGGEYVFSLLEAAFAGDAPDLMRLASELAARSISLSLVLQEMASLLIRLQVVKAAPSTIDEDDPDGERLQHLAQHISGEFLQLAYQIVIHGRQDLPLAPDEYGGFLMTLLRLCAFRPDTVSEVVFQAATRGAQSARHSSVPAAASASAKVVIPPAPVEDVAAASSVMPNPVASQGLNIPPLGAEGQADWRQIVADLPLTGLARELAQNCELRELTREACFLRLPPTVGHLQMKASVDKLQSVLAEHLGRPIALRIELAQAQSETPAVAATRERRLQQEGAVAAIENDAFVRDMTDMFDATVLNTSIRPIS